MTAAESFRGGTANYVVFSPDGRTLASAGGYGIHWPDIDEDLSTEGLLRGAPAPGRSTAT